MGYQKGNKKSERGCDVMCGKLDRIWSQILQGELEWEGSWLSPKCPLLYPLVPSTDTTKEIAYKEMAKSIPLDFLIQFATY